MGYLQQYGLDYAHFLMRKYENPDCTLHIEDWRNRVTRPYDRDKITNISFFPNNLTRRQRKQIVDYAKEYISNMISDYWATHP